MGTVPVIFVAAAWTLASFFSPSRLCAAETMYAEKGSSVELPCSCSSCSGEFREVSWLFYRNGNTIPIFHKMTHTRVPAVLGHLTMLQNYSLYISNVTDNDTGRYWCEQMYYDLVVVTGSKKMMESFRADVACYILSCSVSTKELVWNVASWWEGDKQLKEEDEKREYGIFKGKRVSQLHICLAKDQGKESNQEGRTTRERKVKCRFDKRMEITFGLTGIAKYCSSVSHNHTLGLQSKGSGISWIFLAVLDALLLLIIFVLGVALWRSRKHQEQLKECTKGASESESMMYENVRTGSEKLRHRNDPALQ